ncbi:hypothetical protein BH23CHL2_BH23CHL2_23360 [soil metagenome]
MTRAHWQARRFGTPLVIYGREQERARLRELLDDALAGHGSLVLISGEAGIGKTALVEDLSREAETQGCHVLWGRAYDLSVTPPYGPWLEILRLSPAPAEELLQLLTISRDMQVSSAAGSQDALFAAVAEHFQDIALRQPLVLVLDDLHWADQSSLDFLRYLARQITPHRILLAATYRSDELHRHHPLYTLLALVVREANAERLQVRPLDADGHRALIASRYVTREEDTTRLEQYLEAHAEGNPLFALELLRSLEEDGILQRIDDVWSLGDTVRVHVPPLLRQVIERRLGRLGDELRSLLQVAAIIGQEVPLELWQQITAMPDEILAAAIEQGQAAHLLEEVPGGTSVRFQHALLREALYEGMVSLRRRSWHRKVAEALAARSKPVPDDIAHHFRQAGDVRAVSWLLESARRARMTFATTTAIERLETALLLDEQHDGTSGLHGWLLAGLAGLGELFSHVDERMRMLDEAMDIAVKAHDDALRGLVEWYRAIIETNFSAPVGEMLENARDRIENLAPGEQERLIGFIYGAAGGPLDPSGPELTCLVIGFQAQSGQYHEALARVEAVRVEHSRLSAVAELGIDNALMASYQGLGRPNEALHVYDRLLASHRRDHISDWAAVVAWLKLRDLVLVYWPDRTALRKAVADDAVAAVRLAKAEQTFDAETPDELGIASLLLIDGRWDDARCALEPLADHWASLLATAPWMVLSRHQGEPDAALARLPRVFPDGQASQPGRQTFETSAYCIHAAIEIALDAGDMESARAWLACHDRWIDWSGHIPFATIGHLLWARHHYVAGDRFTAEARARQALALASEPRQPLALLAAHRFLGKLAVDASAFDQARDHLVQSLELTDACSAPFEKALTLVEVARSRIAQGSGDDAREALDGARAICERLQARPTLDHIAELEAVMVIQARAKEKARAANSA